MADAGDENIGCTARHVPAAIGRGTYASTDLNSLKGRVRTPELNKYERGASASTATAHQEEMDFDFNAIPPDYIASFASSIAHRLNRMEDDDFSGLETPIETDSPAVAQGQMEKQLDSLKTYLDSLPYECESPQVMQTKLEFIVGKIDVCVRSKNWSLVPNWSHLLHWYAILLYTTATFSWLNSSQLAFAEISDPRLNSSQARAAVL